MELPRIGYKASARIGLSSVLCATGLLAALPADAQQRLPGVVDRPAIEVPSEVTEPKDLPQAKEPVLEQPAQPAQAVAQIKQVTFSGDLLVKEAQLQAVAAPYLNRPLTRGDIAKLKYELTKLYYKHGFVLTRATTPPQDLADGVLKVVMVTGRIGEMEVVGEGLNPKVADAMASAKIKQGEPFHEKTVESALKDIDDLTNISAKLNLRPGKAVGTTDLKLILETVDEDVQLFTFDNYGAQLTGELVAGLHLQKSNLFGRGETLAVDLRKSEDDLQSVELAAAVPVGWRNLKLELDYLNSDNEIGDYLAPLGASGDTQRFGVAVSSSLYNQLQQEGVVRIGIDAGRYRSYLVGVPETEDNITHAYVEGTWLRRATKQVWYASLRLNKGLGILGADDKGEADATRASGNPKAWSVQPLIYANFRLTERDYVQLFGQGQYATQAQLSSDLFAIGGYGSVRGFQPAQEVGERGFIASAEYSRQLHDTGPWSVKGGAFVDVGYVSGELADSILDDTLKSAGLALEGIYNHSSRYRSKLRLDWAHTLGSYNATTVDDNSFYFRFTQTF